MHRQPLLDMLARYERRFPKEQSVVARIRTLIEHHVDCFDRTCRPGHITGSAWILSPDRELVLLTHHRKLGRWLQLGGHTDGQSCVEQVALREAQEESGMEQFSFPPEAYLHEGSKLLPLDIDVHIIPERRDQKGELIEDSHEHHDIRFLLVTAPGQEIAISHESHDLRWFTHDEVPTVTSEPSVLRMLDKTAELLS